MNSPRRSADSGTLEDSFAVDTFDALGIKVKASCLALGAIVISFP
jgi:hypothetical protein